jgi:hypothetical protein
MIDHIAGAPPARPPRGWAGMLALEGMLGGGCSSYRLWGVGVSVRVAQHNNKGDRIGSLDTNDNVVTINRLNDIATVTVRESRHGQGRRRSLGIRRSAGRQREKAVIAASRTPPYLCFRMGMSESASFQV